VALTRGRQLPGMAIYSLNIRTARFGGNQDHSSTDREVRSIYILSCQLFWILSIVSYTGRFKQNETQIFSYRPQNGDTVTFQMPVSSWAFHVGSSRESFVKFTLGCRCLKFTRARCCHTVVASCRTHFRSTCFFVPTTRLSAYTAFHRRNAREKSG